MKAPHGAAIIVMLVRNPRDHDLVDYTFTHVWHTGSYTDKHGRVPHRKLAGQGSLIHPGPVDDVTLTVDGLTARAHMRPGDAGLHTPGRERSGLENVLPQPALPPEPPPESAATTSEPPRETDAD